VQALHTDPEKLKRDLVRHEVHLIAGHPQIRRAIFPSKIWNSIAAGRRLICTGFAGEMATELEETKRALFGTHLDQWTRLLVDLATCSQPLTSTEVRALTPARPDLQPAVLA
jgi:hypothetical protein